MSSPGPGQTYHHDRVPRFMTETLTSPLDPGMRMGIRES
jgi:hypothetical protein